jgi:protein ImuB
MTLSQADALVRGESAARKNEPAHMLPHDGQADNDALEELAERCAERLSPLVAIEPLDDFLWAGQTLHHPEALIMDVSGVGNLFGGEAGLVAAAKQLLDERGYAGRVAIADTVGAAWGVARCAPTAESATRPEHGQRPPFEAWIVPPTQQRRALEPLRIAALRVHPDTATTLRRLGVDRIGGLLRLPRAGLTSRFGPQLLTRLDQALGEIEEPLPIHHAAASDRIVVDLEYPTAEVDILGYRLERMVQGLANGLARRGRGVLRLGCRLECQREADGSFPPALEIRLGLFSPTAAVDHLHRLLVGDLQRHRLRSPVGRLVLAATMTGKLGLRQPTLAAVADHAAGSVTDLARLIDSLSGRLGRGRVLTAHDSHNPLPEQAVRLIPLAGQPAGVLVPGRPAGKRSPANRSSRNRASTNRNSRNSGKQTPVGSPAADSGSGRMSSPLSPGRRPLFLLRRPAVITPLAGMPSSTTTAPTGAGSQPPPVFRAGGRIRKVTRYWGPERLETGWWHGPMHRRDYYRVETECGQWYWIFYDLRDDRWLLHGRFG